MEHLITKFRRRLTSVETRFVRGLYGRIEWNARAISIQGARGTGKSTMLLQHVLLGQLPLERTLYLSLDDLHFQDHRLEEVAEEFILHGGRHLLLDEVHKYPGWQAVVKNLYDFNPDLRIAVSGSSILALQDALPDLGRRMLIYDLPELSLREFIALKHRIELPAITWESLLDDHVRIAMEYAAALKHPLAHVKEHHVFGATRGEPVQQAPETSFAQCKPDPPARRETSRHRQPEGNVVTVAASRGGPEPALPGEG